ncbi:HupE/UreJ family protein [Paenibacillus psychroresistens]|uniref:HupE/UreJ family protein n=1 Tax=Paenibacillus psychroresistens TaxID=1778678 RepID=A0A6B8RS87_9BACL|nr:HupE/UreJ family protein [Paenibacillus psychroresistens]QGQ99270.1 HupE/UreJ family protein [Paenibacillus psychroresistens]
MVKKWIGIIVLTLALFGLWAPATFAHGGDSLAYSDISVKDGVIKYNLQIDMYDLRAGATPDDPNRGDTTSEAMKEFVGNSHAKVEAYLLSQIKLYADNLLLEGKLTQLKYLDRDNQPFAEVILEYPAGNIPQHFVLDYNLVFDMDVYHVNYVTLTLGDLKQNAVLVNELRELQVGQMNFQHAVQNFSLLGFKSILLSYASILFLLGLLIGIKSLKQIFVVIGSFAFAHSLSLILASLQILTLPVKFVESAIALSILYIALNNLFNKHKELNLWLIGCFSLFHGFGFAEIISGMNHKGGYFAPSLIAFNLGIEVGLVLIVLILYPIIHYIRKIKQAIPAILMILALLGFISFIARAYL